MCTLIWLFIIALAFAQIKEEDSVLILNDDNFDDAIKQYENLLVVFYAPWCGRCKQVNKDFSEAAKELRTLDLPSYLAKVDATLSTNLDRRYNIRSFPTILFFKNGISAEYMGEQKKEDIVKYLEQKVGPIASTFSTTEELKSYIRRQSLTLVGYFDNTESTLYKKWTSFLVSNDNFNAVHIIDPSIADDMHVQTPSIILYKSLDDYTSFSDDFNKLEKWAILNMLPDIIPFSKEYSHFLFLPELNIHNQLLFFGSKVDLTEHQDTLEAIAKKYRDNLFVVHISPSKVQLYDYFGIDKQTPSLIMADFSKDPMIKYKLNSKLNENTITYFVQDYFDHLLEPYWKSEAEVKQVNNKPYKLIGSTFDKIAYDPTKNVMVLFYAPHCNHCIQFMPIYEQLYSVLDDKDIVIAQMDATANEVSDIVIHSFPTLKFFKAGGDGREVVEYEGERSLDALVEFIKNNRVQVDSFEDEDEDEEL